MRNLKKLHRLGRRRFLTTLGTFGLSATTLKHITPEVINSLNVDLEEKVPYVAAYRHTNHEEVLKGAKPEREPVWETVPRDHWTRVETAHDGRDRIHTESNLIAPGVTTNDQKVVQVDYTTWIKDDGSEKSPDISFIDILLRLKAGGIPTAPRLGVSGLQSHRASPRWESSGMLVV